MIRIRAVDVILRVFDPPPGAKLSMCTVQSCERQIPRKGSRRRPDRLANVIDDALDERRIISLGHDADQRLGPRGSHQDAAGLAEACPDTTFVLQHAGMLEDLSPAGHSAWRAGMARLAAFPNVVTKLSGLGTFIHRNDPAHIAAIIADTVAIFGPDRCLFGSNFPIEKLWTNYRDLIEAYLDATRSNPRHRDAIMHDTAVRVYRPAP